MSSDRNLSSDISDVSLWGTYLTLLLLLLVCFIVHFVVQPGDLLSGFSLDVAAEIVGILLVIFSVDRVIDAERERQRRKLEKVALRQLHKSLRRHVEFLVRLGGDSLSGTKPHHDDASREETSVALDGIFNMAYLSRIENLRLQDPVPDERGDVIWSNYLLRECTLFREALNLTIEKYSLFLLPELVNAIESAASSVFLWDMMQLPYATRPAMKAVTSLPYMAYRSNPHRPEPGYRADLKLRFGEHVSAFLNLIAVYNQCVDAGMELTYSSDIRPMLEGNG